MLTSGFVTFDSLYTLARFDSFSVTFKMQFIQQRLTLPITNVDVKVGDKKKIKSFRHSQLLPDNIRCIICGPSNCGKTNVVVSLLEEANGLRFANVYIYSKSLYQPKYIYLKNLFSKVKEIGFFMFSNSEQLIPLEDVRPNSVFIFDDVITERQNNIRTYFCMGRHKNVDCFYLSQSYSHIPKHLIRENANFIILFKQDDMNLRHIFNDFAIASDMSFDTFKVMCNKCWENKYEFLTIDIERSGENGKYRKGFDKFIKLNRYK